MRTINHQKRAEKTIAILDAVRGVFAEKGFHQAGMQELCQTANTSPGAMYSYFASKNDIINAIASQSLVTFGKLASSLASSADPLEVLKTAIYEDMNDSDISLMVEIYAEAARNDAVASLLKASRMDLLQALEAAFLQKGVKEPENKDIAYIALGLYDTALLQKSMGITVEAESLIKTLESVITAHGHDNTLWKKAAGRFSSALFAK